MSRSLPLIALALLVSAFQPFSPSAFSAATAAELNVRNGLPHVRAKIDTKNEVRVAFLGGSITAANGWRVHTLDLLRKTYLGAKFTEIFAAVSGTGSDYGACRVQRDVLDKNPDLVFVEFAVNDSGVPSPEIEAQMEGIVRQIRKTHPATDICFVYTLNINQLPDLQKGRYQPTALAMENVADHYGIPSIHFGIEVARLVDANKLIFHAPASVPADTNGNDPEGRIIFTRDKTHPAEVGHRVYAITLARTLPALIKASTPSTTNNALVAPLSADNWENAHLIPIPDNATPANSTIWRKLPATDIVARHAGQMAPPIWATFTPGASVEFRFKGTRFGIIGLKGAENGKFRCTIDNEPAEIATLFDSFSTPGRHPLKPWFYPKTLTNSEHIVRIELLADKIDKLAIMKQHTATAAETTAYAEHGLYLCGLLLIGEPLDTITLK